MSLKSGGRPRREDELQSLRLPRQVAGHPSNWQGMLGALQIALLVAMAESRYMTQQFVTFALS